MITYGELIVLTELVFNPSSRNFQELPPNTSSQWQIFHCAFLAYILLLAIRVLDELDYKKVPMHVLLFLGYDSAKISLFGNFYVVQRLQDLTKQFSEVFVLYSLITINFPIIASVLLCKFGTYLYC